MSPAYRIIATFFFALLAQTQRIDKPIEPNAFTAPLNDDVMYMNSSFIVTWNSSTSDPVELILIQYDDDFMDIAGKWELVRSTQNDGKWIWETVGLVERGTKWVEIGANYMISLSTRNEFEETISSQSGWFEILPAEDAPEGGNSASPPTAPGDGDNGGSGDDTPTSNNGGGDGGAVPGPSGTNGNAGQGIPTSPSTPLAENNSNDSKGGIGTGAIIGIIVGILAVIGLSIGAFMFLRKKKQANLTGPTNADSYDTGKAELGGTAIMRQPVSDEKVAYVAAAVHSENGSSQGGGQTTVGGEGVHEVAGHAVEGQQAAPTRFFTSDGGMYEVEGTIPPAGTSNNAGLHEVLAK